jgi:hypothetical protein
MEIRDKLLLKLRREGYSDAELAGVRFPKHPKNVSKRVSQLRKAAEEIRRHGD